ncbi:MAG: flippase-like domain-containing protein, partial [Hyphomicrobiales bacterium]|nr:flippase-like domain-containing protein [Hyphomicrobiales bacterium]
GRFSKNRAVTLLLKAAVTIACFWYVFVHVDVGELRRDFSRVHLSWVAVTLLLLVVQIPLVALRWMEIIRTLKAAGTGLSYPYLCLGTAIGQFFGQVMLVAAGDGVRAWFLTRLGGGWRDALISVALDRCVGVGLLLAFSLAILFLPSHLGVFAGYRTEVIAILAGILLVCLSVLVFGGRLGSAFRGSGLGAWIGELLSGARNVAFGPHAAAILGIGCLIHVLTIGAVWSLARAQGLALSVDDAAVLFAIMVGVSLIPIAVGGGWGLREFAMVSLLGGYGLGAERALAFSLYFGFCVFIASLPGVFGWVALARPQASPIAGADSRAQRASDRRRDN